MTDPQHIRFDGWTLDRTSGELTRDGKTQRLPPQPLAMLVALIDRAGEVVTREDLVKVLWPKGVVDFDNSLNAAVRKLRVVLGDDSEKPRYIETLPRIGYRFVGKVEGASTPAPAPDAPTLVPASSKPPWISRGPLLMAAALVIMAVLAWVKWPGEQPAPAAATSDVPGKPTRRTTNERAYEAYLQGTFNRSRRDINGNALSLANFETALKEDPYYADAYAGLAETLYGSVMTQPAPPTAPTYERAKTAALRAIELDDQLGHGHAALAHIAMMYDHDFKRAERENEIARRLDPDYSRNWHTLGVMRAFQGRLPEALEAMRRAREIEPMNLLFTSNYGVLLYNSRRYDDAIAHARALLASQPRLDQARSLLIRSFIAKGDVPSALEQLSTRHSEQPHLADAGFIYAHAGRRAEALAEVERIERMGKDGKIGVGFDVAIIQAALGDVPAACTALKRTVRDHSRMALWMRSDPRMDPVREQPCFAEVVRELYGE